MTSTGGVITRAISVAADAAILLFTFLVTRSILKISTEHRAQSTLMSMLIRNGQSLVDFYINAPLMFVQDSFNLGPFILKILRYTPLA